MNYSPINTGILAVAVLLSRCLIVFGADPRPTTGGATPPPDKSAYTLFSPTPQEQLRPMDVDRPNQTNTPHTIDAGHLQVETGLFDYAYDRHRYPGTNARSDALALGQFNLRLGVLNDLELNAVIDAYAFQRNTDYLAGRSVRRNGVGDTSVGAKLNLWGNDGADGVWATALAIQPQFKLPTAREPLGNGHPELFVGIPFQVNLPADVHLGLQTTVSWERNAPGTGYVTGWRNSASIDRVLFDKFDVYLEYASHVSTQRHQKTPQTLDVGLTYPLTDNIILDTGINIGLNKVSPTLEWLTGVSIRF